MLICFSQCICDNDITKYKWIVRQWAYSLNDIHLLQETHANATRWPPYGYRYVVMARLERDVSKGLHDHIEVALHPETDSDVQEITSWLHNLLYCIHREVREFILRSELGTCHSSATYAEIPPQCQRVQPTPTKMVVMGCFK